MPSPTKCPFPKIIKKLKKFHPNFLERETTEKRGERNNSKMGKKKGRPSLLDIQKRNLRLQQQQQQQQKPIQNQALKNRNPNPDDDVDYERSNGRRKEKKLKLVHQITNSTNFLGSDDGDRENTGQWNNSSKGTDAHQDLGPTTPFPDKKLLEFILDRLQKKDTYGVFLEPVDPNELPDYHDIIKNPMDFATVRKKLSNGAYANLEQFEKDVFLICSNAMQYNSSDTIYYRQAKAIQELAKKNFENLRQESDDSESEPKAELKAVARRGRPPSKNNKEAIAKPLANRVTDISSNTTLANAKDGIHWSNSTYNWSRNVATPSYNLRQIEPKEYSGYGMKVNSSKYGKGVLAIDENRRNTYMQPHPATHVREPSVLTAFDGDMQQLVPNGLHIEHAYARSLVHFAANLGPIGWAIAAKRIERVLPPGIKFGRGWIGEGEAPRTQHSQPPLLSTSPCHPSSEFNISPSNDLEHLSRTLPPVATSIAPSRGAYNEGGGGGRDGNIQFITPTQLHQNANDYTAFRFNVMRPTRQMKQDSVPPDLNIRFRSPGSPASGAMDLALQL